ncbi:phosphoadenylyl-sulfate reductase [Coraliomargarita akajimensis]|uniref:Phosphoadenosine 5'-phosphosulfate reductase n=1 Tax=Coraliomargarita akajimensis (strain DSM 45221 / IAM 15411 / JCM 23193 / KCTC 12865 / 04OKA010-24) TaxID=583355 RepID=D5EQ62_CORAD|nr:phosphoadenylyl-sulfate reductase [Coraliomargarita akajimensis]ADE53830.1 phosphoadenosine phosphosulfate reductase [Coraliomargarita akajimensis DSM 45221]
MSNEIASSTEIQLSDLEGASAVERVRWAHETYGDKLVLTTSFGVQSAVMLHLVTSQVPDIPVVFIDTGYLFPETYRFAEELTERLNLNLQTFRSLKSAAHQEAIYGKLWEQGLEGLESYNRMNKVEPMNRAVTELGASAWLSGLRRVQSSSRSDRQIAEKQNKIWKVYPILDWSDRDIYNYLTENNLPYHPLWDEGYVSVGDWHSTSKLGEGMSAEDTRFGGLKRECGLHEVTGGADYQI